MIIAAIAQRFLDSDAKDQINALLSDDQDNLTATDFASRAIQADKYILRFRPRHDKGALQGNGAMALC